MSRHAKHVCELEDGRKVGYSPRARGGWFRVLFPHPTTPGKYVEPTTGVPVPKGWNRAKSPPADWFSEAHKAIRAAYAAPDIQRKGASRPTWEEAEVLIAEGISRDASLRTYRSALALVKAALPDLPGPSDVTPGHAERFLKKYASERYRRSNSEEGATRPRSAQTVKTTLNNLSVLWVRMKKLRLVEENVWSGVERPRVPRKLPVVAPEEAFANLFRWLDERFPGPDGQGWPLLKLFLDVKSLAGCRLNDLCQAETSQFDPKAGTLLITADQDKTHRERLITLPPDVAAALDRMKGDRYLWERYSEDSATRRPGKGRATRFTPSVMYHAVQSIFREYNAANPGLRVKTHDFRRRAITLTAMALNGDLNATAQAIPVTPATAGRHYFDAKQAYDAAAIQRKTATILLGNRAQTYQKPAV